MWEYKSFYKVLDNDFLNRTLQEHSKEGWKIKHFECFEKETSETYILILKRKYEKR